MAAGDAGHYIQCRSTDASSFNYTYPTDTGIDGDTQIHKDSETFTHSTVTNPDDVTVEAAGHYFFNCNLELNDASASSGYCSPVIYLQLNDTNVVGYGKAGNFASAGAGNADTAISASTVLSLAEDDRVEFRGSMTDGESGYATITDRTGWTVIKFPDDWDYFLAKVADGTDDVHVNDTDNTWTNVTWTTAPDEKDANYTHDTATNPHEITLGNATYYLVTASVKVENDSGNAKKRTINILDMALDGTHVAGSYGSIYTRNYLTGQHDWNWVNMEKIIKTSSANQKLSIRAKHVNSTADSRSDVTERAITITELPGAADYIRLQRTSSFGTDSAANFEWNSEIEVDSGTFGHSTVTNPDRITLQQDAFCLYIINAYTEWTGGDPVSGEDNVTSGYDWSVDGTQVLYGGGSTYDRGYTGAAEVGHTGGRSNLITIDTTNGEYVTVAVDPMGNAETDCDFVANEMTLEGVNIDTLINPPAAGARRVFVVS
jgi:hypothetical protein